MFYVIWNIANAQVVYADGFLETNLYADVFKVHFIIYYIKRMDINPNFVVCIYII